MRCSFDAGERRGGRYFKIYAFSIRAATNPVSSRSIFPNRSGSLLAHVVDTILFGFVVHSSPFSFSSFFLPSSLPKLAWST